MMGVPYIPILGSSCVVSESAMMGRILTSSRTETEIVSKTRLLFALAPTGPEHHGATDHNNGDTYHRSFL
jgi:hypothetical protein